MADWHDKALAATAGSRIGAILRCALGKNDPDVLPRFVGRATITSDRFVLASYTAADGGHHMGAFVGSADALERNITNLADHLDLVGDDRAALFAAFKRWIGTDYSHKGLEL